MSTLGRRLNKALARQKATKMGLARFCGVSKAAVSQWCNESTNDLKMANLFAAAKFLDISAEWLATGKGDLDAAQEFRLHSSLVAVPLIRERELADFLAGNSVEDKSILTGEEVSNKAFATSVADVKSEAVNSGQVFIVDPNYSVLKGSKIALILAQGVFMIRDVEMDGPDIFFTGGLRSWSSNDAKFVGGIAAIAEESKKSIT